MQCKTILKTYFMVNPLKHHLILKTYQGTWITTISFGNVCHGELAEP